MQRAAAHAAALVPGFALDLSPAKKVRQSLITAGMLEQRRNGKSFEVRLTPAGVEKAESLELVDAVEIGTPELADVPDAPFRAGADHMLPYMIFKTINSQIKAGKVDVLFIPRETKTKTKYWDEA